MKDRRPNTYTGFFGLLVFWFSPLPQETRSPEVQEFIHRSLVSCSTAEASAIRSLRRSRAQRVAGQAVQ